MVSKTIVAQVTLGSNPSPSAIVTSGPGHDLARTRDYSFLAKEPAVLLSNSSPTNGSPLVTHASCPGSMT